MARVTPASPAPSVARSGEPPAIELRGVRKVFKLESGEHVWAVDGISLEIGRGDFVCVVGPSGHGKSTLLNLIAGFLKPTSGEVLVNGQLVVGPGSNRGVVFQRDTLFLWRRVRDNIGFGPKARGVPKAERESIVDRYLEIIGLQKYSHAWPKQLSGGMRRRVAIAAVFANDPDVLLMDEPFISLDYMRRATLHKVLLDLWAASGKTVFFITHDVDEALALADRVIVITHGQVAYTCEVTLDRPRTPHVLASPEASELRLHLLTTMQDSEETA